MMKHATLLVAATCALTGPACAQTVGDAVAWVALTTTPVGGLPPMPSGATAFVARYGRLSEDGGAVSNVSAGVRVGVFSNGSLTIEAGISRPVCAVDAECALYVFGLELVVPVMSRAIGADDSRTKLNVAVSPSAGLATPRARGAEGTMSSVAVSIPLSLSAPAGSVVRLTPFISPGFGYGRFSAGGESASGTRPMLGGGLAISNARSTLGMTVSFRKVFLQRAPTMFGVGVSVGR